MANAQYIDPENLQKLRARIQKIIEQKNISLSAIIDRTGFTEAQVRRIIYGTKNTSISNLFAIARAIEVHIMEVFIFDFQIPEYDIALSSYRKKEVKRKNSQSKADKPISASDAIKILASEGCFKKTSVSEKEMTLRKIVEKARTKFRSTFKNNEFSSALNYAIKTGRLKRYKKGGTGPFVYYKEEG